MYKIDEGRQGENLVRPLHRQSFRFRRWLEVLVDSKPPMFGSKYFWGGFNGYADRKKIDEDIEKLTDYYHAFGFFQAKVAYYWDFDKEEKWMYLTFVIDEGPHYKVRNISYIGQKVFPVETLSKDAKLHAGDYFNQSAMNKISAKSAISTAATASSSPIANGPIRDCSTTRPSWTWSIASRRAARYRVGQLKISIAGENPHTSYATILDRMTLCPGDSLDQTKLRNDERRLKFSGLYESKNPNKVPKIVFSPPPGMDDPDKQMAKRDRKPGWMGGPSSTDGSGSGSSSSQPFGPAFGSDSSGTNASGSASSGGSSYLRPTALPDGEPDKVLDITFVLPPRDDQPAQQAAAPQPAGQPVAPQLPLRPGDRVEWVDPLSTDVAPATSAPQTGPHRPTTSAPTQQDNSNQPSVESSGPIIRGQEPTESDWTPAWQNPPGQISPIVRAAGAGLRRIHSGRDRTGSSWRTELRCSTAELCTAANRPCANGPSPQLSADQFAANLLDRSARLSAADIPRAPRGESRSAGIRTDAHVPSGAGQLSIAAA